jgi:hypothetical protein
MTSTGELLPVHLLELPVPLAVQSRQHFEELMREFALITAGADAGHPDHHVPVRLTQLVEILVAQFGGVTDDAEQRLDDAIDRGDDVIADHTLAVPPEAGPASQVLNDLIDEADDYCRRGQHLLTLAASDDCAAYRRWHLNEITRQVAGQAPIPWPDRAS